jgi:hypothetical protein
MRAFAMMATIRVHADRRRRPQKDRIDGEPIRWSMPEIRRIATRRTKTPSPRVRHRMVVMATSPSRRSKASASQIKK